ncbi:hypothetical protein [Spirosoma montaniterrae]|uniref:Uncharacterized protein n=1 Tax=Spirosoma montaniterrae TaxID=1178516 RepID=A0A1P9WZ97_9BACT|nr:hypothetical protein [Spirosoma montaniterrae]AQG80695.1 hypothetical protein AWR27_15990 [Spirosoma montaniterrae]
MPAWIDKVIIYDKIYLLLIVLSIGTLLFGYKTLTKNLKVLLLFAAAHFTTEFGSLYIHYGLGRDNYLIYHLFACIGYGLLAAFFFYTLTSKTAIRVVLASVPVYWLLWLLYVLTWEPVTEYCALAFMTEHLFMIVFCFAFFRTILTYKQPYRPEKDRTFWIVTGLFFYFAGNFFILSCYNYIEKHHHDILTGFYYAGYTFNYLLYLTIIVTGFVRFPAHD